MSKGFTKLFSSLTTSTIWQEDAETKVIWITMLALADRDGYVDATIPGLANIANVPLKKCEEAIKKFLSPDKYSRSQEYEGRRIEAVGGSFWLLNYSRYREIGRGEDRREYLRKKQQEQRDKNKRQQSSTIVNKHKHSQPIAEAEAEAEADNKRRTPNNGQFDTFWKLYPNKKGKGAARNAFNKIEPDAQLFGRMLSAVEQQISSEQWQRDSGQFIPHPATWLNQERWDDEVANKETAEVIVARLEKAGRI